MVESSDIVQSLAYKEFEKKHNRHLNMMQENVSICTDSLKDRNLRRQALVEFSKAMDKESSDSVVELFFRERLARRLVISLEDQIEKNRELTIEILTK